MFLDIRPCLLGRLFYWHIIVHSILLFTYLYFCNISCNFYSFSSCFVYLCFLSFLLGKPMQKFVIFFFFSFQRSNSSCIAFFLYFLIPILFFLYFLFYYYYFNLKYCIVFAIHQHASATGVHVFPILNATPPPSPYHPSGSSQCTSPKLPVSCIEPGLAIHFLYDIIHVLMPFSQIIPPLPLPQSHLLGFEIAQLKFHHLH